MSCGRAIASRATRSGRESKDIRPKSVRLEDRRHQRGRTKSISMSTAPMAGRIMADTLDTGGGSASMAGNEMRVAEPEFCFRMARDLPARSFALFGAEVLDAVGTLASGDRDSRFALCRFRQRRRGAADCRQCLRASVRAGRADGADWRSRDLIEERPVITMRGQTIYRPRQERARRSPRGAGLARQ